MPNEYTIVSGELAHGVAERVEKLLSEGWKLYGNLVVAATTTTLGQTFQNHRAVFMYSQAMVKEQSDGN